MSRLFSVVSAALFLALPIFAHADTIDTFSLDGTLNVGTVKGTITIDATTGRITGSDFDVATGPLTFDFAGAPIIQGTRGDDYEATFYSINDSLDRFTLDLPVSSLIAYSGGTICNASCTTGDTVFAVDIVGVDRLQAGDLSPTPEPSSLLLLGTGILGLAGVVRRRIVS